MHDVTAIRETDDCFFLTDCPSYTNEQSSGYPVNRTPEKLLVSGAHR